MTLWPHTLLVLLTLVGSAISLLNLYMSKQETYRIIEIEAEVQYVYRGGLQNSAIHAPVYIPSHVDSYHLVWQNWGSNQPNILYSLNVAAKEPEGLVVPLRVNVSERGSIPSQPQVIATALLCTGSRSFVEVTYHFEFTIVSPDGDDRMIINLVRVKQCEVNRTRLGMDGKRDSTGTDNASDMGFNHPMPTSTEIFYVAVGAASAVIIVIALAICLLYVRTKRHVSQNGRLTENEEEEAEVPLDSNERPSVIGSSNHGSSVVGCESSAKDSSLAAAAALSSRSNATSPMLTSTEMRQRLVEGFSSGTLPISRRSIALDRCLLSGGYGRLHMGLVCVQNEMEQAHEQKVIIKTVAEDATDDEVLITITEASLLRGLTHQFLHPVLAANLETPPLLIYPHSERGNLRLLLRKSQNLNTRQLVLMAIHIGKALHYIHRKKVIHKDVAARNCYVDGDFAVKLSDSVLSRQLFPSDYQCYPASDSSIHEGPSISRVGRTSEVGISSIEESYLLPVRWMALESLSDGECTPATDVWMYGVLLWELINAAETPYADVQPADMLGYLQSGYRLLQSPKCPDELFAIMAFTWAVNPEDRPTLSQILACLSEFHKTLARFI